MGDKPRVVVAMSGGVDSSLTAALLLHEGYDVIGMTMQIWENDERVDKPDSRGCCSLSAVDDARGVADKLGIPYYVVNFRKLFQKSVVDYFIREYGAGKTPNPCIACNRFVKFEGLLHKAQEVGADFLATGHYARITYDKQRQRYLLRKGIDSLKDQSYALYHLNQHTLAHFLFPLGGYTKVQTRQIAREYGLAVADKPDSQEICFVPNDDYQAFLADKSPNVVQPGSIVDQQGTVLGQHQGLAFYTIGQRKGLGFAAGKPFYVIALDIVKNQVIVGENQDVFASECIASDLNWILFDQLAAPLRVQAKIRYGAKVGEAMITPFTAISGQEKVKIVFDQPQRAITPGQSVVFYLDDIVVGGGVIEK